jgi:hypothetical protein
MKTYIVQLDSHDDVISTRDKISWSKARRVLLVWPRHGRVLERRVDLLLLQRHSQQIGVQLAVVTRRDEVRQNARDLGIAVFTKPVQAQQAPWRRPNPRRRSFRPENEQPPDPNSLRQRREQFAGRPVINGWLRIAIFSMGVLSFLALALFFMPGARVELAPVRQAQTLSIAAWANPQISQPNPSGGMPAYALRVEVEGRDMAESSGLALVDDEVAAGSVHFTNLTDQPVLIPAATALLTLNRSAVRFLTTRAVELPAGPGQTAAVPVRAEVPGPNGNVDAGQIRAVEGAIGLRVSVDNLEAVQGGSARRSPAPSPQDYRALHQKLLKQLQLTALEELQARLQPGQRLLYETIRLVEETAEEREPAIGQPADRLQMTLRAEFEGWYVEERDMQFVAQAALDANLPPGFRPVDDSLRTHFSAEPVVDENGAARWMLDAERVLQADWSRELAVMVIRGRSLEDASQILQAAFSLSTAPQITLFPKWWIRLPFLPFRIAVVQQ